MKKYILCIWIVFGVLCLLTVAVSAIGAEISLAFEDGQKKPISAPALTLDPEDPFYVVVHISDVNHLAGAALTLVFDSNAFFADEKPNANLFFTAASDLFVEATDPDTGQRATPSIGNKNTRTGEVLLAGVCHPSVSVPNGQEKALFKVKFKVKSGAADGTYPFSLQKTKLTYSAAGWNNDESPVLVNNDLSGITVSLAGIEETVVIGDAASTQPEAEDLVVLNADGEDISAAPLEAGAVTFKVVFDQVMDADVAPTVQFDGPAIQNGLITTGAGWEADGKTYLIGEYTIGGDTGKGAHTVDVTGGRNPSGAQMDPARFSFEVADVTPAQPTVDQFLAVDADGNPVSGYLGPGTYTFKAVFDRAMDTTVAPAVQFATQEIQEGLMTTGAGWGTDGKTYVVGAYTVDGETGEGEHSVEISGARDESGADMNSARFTFSVKTFTPPPEIDPAGYPAGYDPASAATYPLLSHFPSPAAIELAPSDTDPGRQYSWKVVDSDGNTAAGPRDLPGDQSYTVASDTLFAAAGAGVYTVVLTDAADSGPTPGEIKVRVPMKLTPHADTFLVADGAAIFTAAGGPAGDLYRFEVLDTSGSPIASPGFGGFEDLPLSDPDNLFTFDPGVTDPVPFKVRVTLTDDSAARPLIDAGLGTAVSGELLLTPQQTMPPEIDTAGMNYNPEDPATYPLLVHFTDDAQIIFHPKDTADSRQYRWSVTDRTGKVFKAETLAGDRGYTVNGEALIGLGAAAGVCTVRLQNASGGDDADEVKVRLPMMLVAEKYKNRDNKHSGEYYFSEKQETFTVKGGPAGLFYRFRIMDSDGNEMEDPSVVGAFDQAPISNSSNGLRFLKPLDKSIAFKIQVELIEADTDAAIPHLREAGLDSILSGEFRLSNGVTFKGKIVDSQGKAIAGARITAVHDTRLKTESDRSGFFTAPMTPAPLSWTDGLIYRFAVSVPVLDGDGPRYLDRIITGQDIQNGNIVMRPVTGGRIDGQVLWEDDPPDSIRYCGTLVRLRYGNGSYARHPDGGDLRVLADENGIFSFPISQSLVQKGPFAVEAVKPGYITGEIENIDLNADRRAYAEVLLRPITRVSVQGVQQGSGVDVKVTLQAAAGYRPDGTPFRAFTGRPEEIEVTDGDGGTVSLSFDGAARSWWFSHPGVAPFVITVSADVSELDGADEGYAALMVWEYIGVDAAETVSPVDFPNFAEGTAAGPSDHIRVKLPAGGLDGEIRTRIAMHLNTVTVADIPLETVVDEDGNEAEIPHKINGSDRIAGVEITDADALLVPASDIDRLEVTLKFNSQVKPGDFEEGRFRVFTADSLKDMAAGQFRPFDPEAGLTGIPSDRLLRPVDYDAKEVTFRVDRPGVFGIGDDFDGDGIADIDDAFPFDSEKTADTDGDGIADEIDPDDDGDGVPDEEDAFPKDPEEWLDTDEDGIGNNADEDDDGDGIPDEEDPFPLDPLGTVDTDRDGMPDYWEEENGFDLMDPTDADGDADFDGVTNLEEYRNGTDPQGLILDRPVLRAPEDGAEGVSLTPDLEIRDYPLNRLYKHSRTTWQILHIPGDYALTLADILDEDGNVLAEYEPLILFEATSRVYLNRLPVPKYLLEPGKTYHWRARLSVYEKELYDNLIVNPYLDIDKEEILRDYEIMTEWADTHRIGTTLDTDDTDGNGIPDAYEINVPVLDDVFIGPDGKPICSPFIKSAYAAGAGDYSDLQVGFKTFDKEPVTPAGYRIRGIQPLSREEARFDHEETLPEDLPFGLFTFVVTLDDPETRDEEIEVFVHFSEPAPSDYVWWKYDAREGWYPYDRATFSYDRKSVRLRLKDGEYGDQDETRNGIIIDPSGLAPASAASDNGEGNDGDGGDNDVINDDASGSDSGGGGGGSCFISAVTAEGAPESEGRHRYAAGRWIDAVGAFFNRF